MHKYKYRSDVNDVLIYIEDKLKNQRRWLARNQWLHLSLIEISIISISGMEFGGLGEGWAICWGLMNPDD